MKSFEQWFNEFQPPKEWSESTLELFSHNGISPSEYKVGMNLYYPCCRCGEDSVVYCDAEDFNEEHYCGSSPRCCP